MLNNEQMFIFQHMLNNKQQRRDALYMDIANLISRQSQAVRLKVGCICVKGDQIISMGYNGTPSGWDNSCEEEITQTYETHTESFLVTKPEVLHAEANCIGKLCQSTISAKDSTLYCTHAPCMECAKNIYAAGINRVVYSNPYKNDHGVQFLIKCNVQVNKMESV